MKKASIVFLALIAICFATAANAQQYYNGRPLMGNPYVQAPPNNNYLRADASVYNHYVNQPQPLQQQYAVRDTAVITSRPVGIGPITFFLLILLVIAVIFGVCLAVAAACCGGCCGCSSCCKDGDCDDNNKSKHKKKKSYDSSCSDSDY